MVRMKRSLRIVILYPFHKLNYISASLIQPTIWEKSLYDVVEWKNLQMMRSTGGELLFNMMRWSIVMGAQQLCCWVNPSIACGDSFEGFSFIERRRHRNKVIRVVVVKRIQKKTHKNPMLLKKLFSPYMIICYWPIKLGELLINSLPSRNYSWVMYLLPIRKPLSKHNESLSQP